MLSFFIRCQLVYLGLRRDRRAVTTVEYGLIAALLSVIIITAVSSLGKGASSTFGKIASEL